MEKAALLLCLSLFALNLYADDSCRLPEKIESPNIQGVDCRNDIAPDSYVLALSWSPQHCSTIDPGSAKKHEFQCELNKFGFVVHGLWGQSSAATEKCQQPRNCSKSLVDNETVLKNLCTVPGVALIQAQWQKHGSCTGMSVTDYFDKTRELWSEINKPEISDLLNEKNQTTAGEISKAFVERNKELGLTDASVAVRVASKNYLGEVFICYDTSFKFTACTVGKAPVGQLIRVIPVER